MLRVNLCLLEDLNWIWVELVLDLLDDVLRSPADLLHCVLVDDVRKITLPDRLHLLFELLSDTYDSLDRS